MRSAFSWQICLKVKANDPARAVAGLRSVDDRPGGGRRVVVLSVIDNLVKGAAGQAVQNMNLMTSLPETMGLEAIGMMP